MWGSFDIRTYAVLGVRAAVSSHSFHTFKRSISLRVPPTKQGLLF